MGGNLFMADQEISVHWRTKGFLRPCKMCHQHHGEEGAITGPGVNQVNGVLAKPDASTDIAEYKHPGE